MVHEALLTSSASELYSTTSLASSESAYEELTMETDNNQQELCIVKFYSHSLKVAFSQETRITCP